MYNIDYALHEVEDWHEYYEEPPFEIVDPDEYRLTRERTVSEVVERCLRGTHGKR